MPVLLGAWQQAECFKDSLSIHPLVYLGTVLAFTHWFIWGGDAHHLLAPTMLAQQYHCCSHWKLEWRVENKILSSWAPPHTASQRLLPPLCPRSCHHGSGSAPHNLDGCFISMATFLLKNFRVSPVPFDNEGSSVSHSVPCKRLRETTLTPLSTSFPHWQAIPAQRAAGLVPAASLLPVLLSPAFSFALPLSSRRLPFCCLLKHPRRLTS